MKPANPAPRVPFGLTPRQVAVLEAVGQAAAVQGARCHDRASDPVPIDDDTLFGEPPGAEQPVWSTAYEEK